ncbi:MAG: hypothetical protein IT366_07265 [Candidatus Hydrogenedentes bacterium]|nr:hypothetical protein [Candidatus Hydrogenedentota bacterium]
MYFQLLIPLLLAATPLAPVMAPIDYSNATVHVSKGQAGKTESVVAQVLVEEFAKRTGKRLEIENGGKFKGSNFRIQLVDKRDDKSAWKTSEDFELIESTIQGEDATITISAPSRRGLLFGVGKLLSNLRSLEAQTLISTDNFGYSTPAYAIRGHQLGYRHAANSWDAWTVEQFDQYIRELAFFGTNCIENIPFQDDRSSPLMKLSREEANLAMGEICAKYDLDYWVWTPADFDLKDEAKRAAQLQQYEDFCKKVARLDGVFFPGGDPGDNDPSLVMPYLVDVSKIVKKHFPKCGIWISLQGFNKTQVDYFYEYMNREQPKWLTGLVSGPSSPRMEEGRRRMPAQYKHRHYPDITHSVRAQYPVTWWDAAFGMTLGRECVNPRPIFESALHNYYAPLTDGFLTYSDGVHDDMNKVIWSLSAWDPKMPVRDQVLAYTRTFFGAKVAEEAADGILALEKNWEGPIGENGGIDATLALWDALDAKAPELRGDWRWQMYQLRAVYDAYQRHRNIFETALEEQANAALIANASDPAAAMDAATAIMNRAVNAPVRADLRKRIDELCEALFKSIQLQTSVEKYTASGAERGAVLDMVDRPLNNRWWLEDEFKKVREMTDKNAQIARLKEIATWENPEGCAFYDSVGNVSKAQRVLRGETTDSDPNHERSLNPDHVWKDNGLCRDRISWMTYLDWPVGVRYPVEPGGNYVLRMTGQGVALTKVDGERVQPTKDGKTPAEFKEFPVPASATEDGTIVITWDVPDEQHLNWRQRSRLNEIWLIKK